MQFSIAAIAIFLTSALAVPYEEDSTYSPCVGLLSGTPQCCDVDVLGVVDLSCVSPPTVPTSAASFNSICANDGGKSAKCCTLPVLDQGLVCTTPQGL